jgi:hypothetical protein
VTVSQVRVGKDTEQRVARWLRDNGFPHAERRVKTGYTTSQRIVSDAGDIDGTPGIVWQIKSLRTRDRRTPGADPNTGMEREVPGWLLETEAQRQAANAHAGILVVRRWGTTDVGRWWAFFPAGAFVHLTGGRSEALNTDHVRPLRLELRHAVEVLRVFGYAEGAA